MNELDSLRQEAETLKNAIRVSVEYICILLCVCSRYSGGWWWLIDNIPKRHLTTRPAPTLTTCFDRRDSKTKKKTMKKEEARKLMQSSDIFCSSRHVYGYELGFSWTLLASFERQSKKAHILNVNSMSCRFVQMNCSERNQFFRHSLDDSFV